MQTVGWVLFMALQVYIYILIGRMVVSWIPMFAPRWRPRGIIAGLFEVIYTLTDPPIKALRRIIPPLNLGGVSLDLAFMAVFILVIIAQRVVLSIFY